MRNGFRVVSPGIVDQIELASESLQRSPAFDIAKQHRLYHFLRVESAKHSAEMELNGHKVRKGRSRRIAEENLRAAQAFFHEHYRGALTDRLLFDTVAIVEPGLVPAYRGLSSPTTYSGDRDPIVYPTNVAEQMEEFIPVNNSLITSVGKAVHSHFHIARVHPFADGNGRLARLVQNGILRYYSLPPIIIEPSERIEYTRLLKSAEREYTSPDQVTVNQARFFNYLALKLRDSLRTVERNLR